MQVECILIILKIKEGKHAGIILIYKFITGKVGYGYYKKWGWQVFIGGDSVDEFKQNVENFAQRLR